MRARMDHRSLNMIFVIFFIVLFVVHIGQLEISLGKHTEI
jgi:hypothetical protein